MRGAESEKDYLFLKTGYEQEKIFFNDIHYLEAAGNYVSFVLKDKALLTRMTINEAEAVLPGQKFVRVHRSFVIAVAHITKIERHQVWTRGTAIPIGSAYAQNLPRLF